MNVAQAEVLNLESGAKQVLQETFGYQQFRPGQEEIIDTVLSGRDCLVVMPLVAENPFAIKSLPYC